MSDTENMSRETHEALLDKALREATADSSKQLDEAQANGAKLDMTALVDGYYAEVQALGGNRWDTSSLVARLEK